MLIASLFKDVSCVMLSEPDFHVPASSPIPADAQLPALLGLTETFSEKTAINLAGEQQFWSEQSKTWHLEPQEGEGSGTPMPGLFTTPLEYSTLPRMLLLEGWNPDVHHATPPFRPTCLSTRSTLAQYNLTPSAASEGWEFWVHEEHRDKPYLVARVPGSRVVFEMETRVGVVKMYSLRSGGFGLGSVECWVDGERDKAVRVDGWWDKGDM